MRVRPYYLYQMDLITGGSHFKVDVRKASKSSRRSADIPPATLFRSTSSTHPRRCKVPINPDYVEKITDDEVVFRNYEGKRYRYPLKSTRPSVEGAPARRKPTRCRRFSAEAREIILGSAGFYARYWVLNPKSQLIGIHPSGPLE